MIDAAAHQVLADLSQCLLVALPLGLLAYRWVWRRDECTVTGTPGLPCDGIDLANAVGLVVLLSWQAGARPIPPSADGPGLTSADLVVGIGFQVLLVLLLLAYLYGARGRRLTQWLGLRSLSIYSLVPWAVLGTAAAMGMTYFSAGILNHLVWEPLGFEPEPQEVVRTFADATNPVLRGLIAVGACVVAPLIEETVFRGFLYPVLRHFTDVPFAALFTALLFGVGHSNLAGAVPLSLLGLGLAMAYQYSRGLVLPIAIHALFNAASLALMWGGWKIADP